MIGAMDSQGMPYIICKQWSIQSRLNTQVPERMLTVYADLDWDIAAQGESAPLPEYASSWLWDEIRLIPGWKDNGLATLLILRQEPFFEGEKNYKCQLSVPSDRNMQTHQARVSLV